MNKQTIKDFLADPLVQDALKTDGEAEVGEQAVADVRDVVDTTLKIAAG